MNRRAVTLLETLIAVVLIAMVVAASAQILAMSRAEAGSPGSPGWPRDAALEQRLDAFLASEEGAEWAAGDWASPRELPPLPDSTVQAFMEIEVEVSPQSDGARWLLIRTPDSVALRSVPANGHNTGDMGETVNEIEEPGVMR